VAEQESLELRLKTVNFSRAEPGCSSHEWLGAAHSTSMAERPSLGVLTLHGRMPYRKEIMLDINYDVDSRAF